MDQPHVPTIFLLVVPWLFPLRGEWYKALRKVTVAMDDAGDTLGQTEALM